MENINTSPIISVFTTCKNHAVFLKDTIDSILCQSFQDFEIIIVDGGSSDNTIEILEAYTKKDKRIKYYIEKSNVLDGFIIALEKTTGKFVMPFPISDGLIDKKWFERCINILEKDNEVSLVWGLFNVLKEDGSFGNVFFNDYFKFPPPQKKDFFGFWLVTSQLYPEINYIARANIYKNLFPKFSSPDLLDNTECFTAFVCNFNINGYLPFFIPAVAAFSLAHIDRLSNTNKEPIAEKTPLLYSQKLNDYKKSVLSGSKIHYYRNGNSDIIDSIQKKDLKHLKKRMFYYKVFCPPNLILNSRIPRYNIQNIFDKLYIWLHRFALLFSRSYSK